MWEGGGRWAVELVKKGRGRSGMVCVGTIPLNHPTPHGAAPPCQPHPTAPPHRVRSSPPSLPLCTTPLSDRTLRPPPPTPCPIMRHTQASLCDRPCLPCSPPSPERGLPQPQRATPALCVRVNVRIASCTCHIACHLIMCHKVCGVSLSVGHRCVS